MIVVKVQPAALKAGVYFGSTRKTNASIQFIIRYGNLDAAVFDTVKRKLSRYSACGACVS